jgi:hypothetical protein
MAKQSPKQIPKQPIYRPVQKLDADVLQHAWDCINEARAALALPIPSTFLGKAAPPTNENEDEQ